MNVSIGRNAANKGDIKIKTIMYAGKKFEFHNPNNGGWVLLWGFALKRALAPKVGRLPQKSVYTTLGTSMIFVPSR